MNKVITFALWGDNPKYTIGAIENAKLAKELFCDWQCRFYFNRVPGDIIDQLKALSAQVIEMPSGPWQFHGRRAGNVQPDNSMFWKIETYFDKSVDIFIARDCDSRLSLREKMAIDQWIAGDWKFHIIRDHPADCGSIPILGAMWGMKTSLKLNMKKYIQEFIENAPKRVDQLFLKQYIYPRVKDVSLIHHDESCAAGCQLEKDDSNYWHDGDRAVHKLLASRNWFKFSECIGIDYTTDNQVVEQSLNWLKLWQKTGTYWWKRYK